MPVASCNRLIVNRLPDACESQEDNAPCQCQAEGGTWVVAVGHEFDAGAGSGVEGHCVIPCPGPSFNCAADAAMGDAATSSDAAIANDASHHAIDATLAD